MVREKYGHFGTRKVKNGKLKLKASRFNSRQKDANKPPMVSMITSIEEFRKLSLRYPNFIFLLNRYVFSTISQITPCRNRV
ncbi:MAG: hypothetical protein ACTSV5_08190 [Promethearchaeota archaeon]